MAYLRFLYGKIRGYSLATLLRLECESALFGLFGLVPTTFGVLLRGAAFQMLSRRCRGFAWIQPHVVIVHADRIEVGRNFAVNSHTYLNGIGGLTIGDDVLIGSSVTISTGMHPIDGHAPAVIARQSIPRPIIIEDDVWIGAGVVLVPGIRLRKGSVIGANAVVTGDTEEYAVMVGAPARKIRSR